MQVNRKLVFTVDQLELVRRLRNSGLTKEQVLAAFDSFECLDSRVNKSLNIPMTLQALQLQALQCLTPMVPSTVALGNSNLTQSQDNRTQQQKQPASLHEQQLSHNFSAAPIRPVLSAQETARPRQDERTDAKSASDSGATTDNSCNSEDVLNNSTGRLTDGGEEEGEVSYEELREFFGRSEVDCLEEIKDFIVRHNVKQQQIAVLAGVSQPYVSRYLRGEFNSMSNRICCAIKRWYLTYRKDPSTIVSASSTLMKNSVGVSRPASAPTVNKLVSLASNDLAGLVSAPASVNDVEVFDCPRRERFVFRPNHLHILERFFIDDNYPSYDKREDIAKACNDSTQDLVGRELIDKEMVTVQTVSNWFANKRKDLKKLYKEEGLDASRVPLRPRGRPSHCYLDSPLVQSILDHQTNVSRSLEKPAAVANDNNSVSNDNIKPVAIDDAAALHFSAEIAAVSQAIMSLAGQKPVNVKTEKADVSEYIVTGLS